MTEPNTDIGGDGTARRIEMSRRGFFKGAGLSAASMALFNGGLRAPAAAEGPISGPKVFGPRAVSFPLSVNGQTLPVHVDPGTTLADMLRHGLGLTGTKIGCDRGACSACSVWVDGEVVASCMTLAFDVRGKQVTTIEGLARGDKLHPVQQAFDVFTNAGLCGAFRAPGQVQGIFALEQSLDELPERLGMNPVALRDRIDTSGTHDSRAQAVERRIGAERFGWGRRRPPNSDPGPVRRGMGMAQSQWVSVVHPATACEVRVTDDGSMEAFSSAQDIGTGTRTVLAQVVAEEFGLRPGQVGSYIGDTRYPVGPPSGGSRVTGSLTLAARDLASRVAPLFEARAEDIVFAAGRVFVCGKPETALPFEEAVRKAGFEEISHRADRRDDYDGYAIAAPNINVSRHGIGGVQFAEVTVDTETGVVRVERIVAVHDCGRPINPKLVESQIDGGVIQGVSYALYEERHLDQASGQQLNANVDQYKMVGSYEVPTIEMHILEQLGGHSSTDARGVAEPANVATAAAIANAFYNATDKRIRTLPLTPAHVLAALSA